MTGRGDLLPAGEVLAGVEALLDRLDADRGTADPATRLDWVRRARRVQARVVALASHLVVEADRAKAAEQAVGSELSSWLGTTEVVSRREAKSALRQARKLGQHPLVGEAAVAGRVGTSQVRAITGVLDSLAPQLDQTQQQQAEHLLVELAGHLDADQLARSAGQVLDTVLPDRADEALETHLQRETEAAWQQRSLRFFFDGARVRFDGSLPRLEAEQWINQLNRHAERARRTAIEHRDPVATRPSMDQRHADALIAIIRSGSDGSAAAGTATVFVNLDYDKLAAGAAGAGRLLDGQQLSAGELRRVCCDADLVPVVLGGPSIILDVGRARRLVSPELRAALIARDGGCVFPGCDAPPELCDAHHVIPWQAGGPTALSNLVLQCHPHHPTVEESKFGIRDQWQVRIAADGLPEFLPPRRIDPAEKPIRHARHRPPLAQRTQPDPAPTDGRNTGPPAA